MTNLQEYDVVRVVKLLNPTRPFDGTEGAMREPQLGDTGTIVHDYEPANAESPVIVESVDSEGHTVWLADFTPEELELVVRAKQRRRSPIPRVLRA